MPDISNTPRSLMVQGTMSNVGKSLLCAGLCRIFAQDGLRVAPFKSQNMALNSGVTASGKEMGRAQIIQAHAAGIEPDVRMNPILLKPTSDTGSQVIVLGQAVASLGARGYHQYRRGLRTTVQQAYQSLARDFDLIIIEGAGSPAEINLNADDIVNMGMARLAHAPVLLVGDIDPGGVFAQLAGTLQLLPAADRARVRGLIVNKFRGDLSILEPGLRQLEALTQLPVLGTVPYLKLQLGDEDSLSAKLTAGPSQVQPASGWGAAGAADIAVIRLPHLSNFTDFDALDACGYARVRYVERASELGRPDMVILPGTKTTMDDLRWLRSTGLDACIEALVQLQTPVLGICGGYQMMGSVLSDPGGSDGGGEEPGLGLLPVKTVFAAQKTLRQVQGHFDTDLTGPFSVLAGRAVRGYEVHMGQTYPLAHADAQSCLLGASAAGESMLQTGTVSGLCMGVYLHGLFDTGGTSTALAQELLRRRGLTPAAPGTAAATFDARAFEEEQLDLLAEHLRLSLDIGAIRRIIEEGCGR